MANVNKLKMGKFLKIQCTHPFVDEETGNTENNIFYPRINIDFIVHYIPSYHTAEGLTIEVTKITTAGAYFLAIIPVEEFEKILNADKDILDKGETPRFIKIEEINYSSDDYTRTGKKEWKNNEKNLNSMAITAYRPETIEIDNKNREVTRITMNGYYLWANISVEEFEKLLL